MEKVCLSSGQRQALEALVRGSRDGQQVRRGQAQVPITGDRAKRILFGAFNPKSGSLTLKEALRWNQDTFQQFLRQVRRHWRGWRIVLFLDRGSPHKAKRSQALARSLAIE